MPSPTPAKIADRGSLRLPLIDVKAEPLNAPSVIALRDYVDVAELRLRATSIAIECGLGRTHQGLVALAVTDAGVFALQQGRSPAAELRVSNDDGDPRLVVVVSETGAPTLDTDAVLRVAGKDRGLMLARQAAERFSIRTEPSSGMTVTMEWAVSSDGVAADGEGPKDDHGWEVGRPTVIDVLRRETGELAVLLEVLRRTEASIEDKAELFAQVASEFQATNRLIGLEARSWRVSEPDAVLEAMVRASADALFSMTLDLVITTWNPAAQRLLGYSPGKIIGQHIDVLTPGEAGHGMDEAVKRLAAGESGPYPTLRRHRDGSVVEVTESLSVIRDSDNRWIGYAAAMQDLADYKRAQRALVSALTEKDRLVEENLAARELQAAAARRLMSCSMTLQGELKLDPPLSVLGWIETVIDEIDAALEEIHLAGGASHHHRLEAVGLRAQLQELAAGAAGALGFEPKVRFVGEVDADMPGDMAEHLVAVAREALSNAVRHAQAEHVGIMVQVGDEAVIAVADDGRGLGKAKPRGGLLALMARADSVGGNFSLTSTAGAGTRLEWRAPLPGWRNRDRLEGWPMKAKGGLLPAPPPSLHLDVLRDAEGQTDFTF
jgi:two-component system, NarL family, sensor histidine kinase DevS